MGLIILALLQAAPLAPPAPPPAYAQSDTADGGFAYVVAVLPAERLSAVEEMLDAAAARRCGARAVVPGDQTYDQATDADGNPSPTITNLRETYRCR